MTGSAAYEALAEAFWLEGVRAHFTLMGDGNMHWASALDALGARTIHVRHEHCACAMAMGYAIASRDVGVASVTCGPGVTQTMTALATAVQGNIPLVVFAGESPIHASWYNQRIDQAPLVAATGARYIAVHSLPRMLEQVCEAFLHARRERQPVVLGMPFDLQHEPYRASGKYVPSTSLLPDVGRIMPDPSRVERAAEAIGRAKRVIVLAGRGAMEAGAQAECEALADRVGALLATTLPVRGLFDHHPFSLGIAGGFSTEVAREAFEEADLIVAVGASLTRYTADAGKLYPNATVVQVDTDPVGLKHGRKAADIYVKADAKAGLAAILAALKPTNGSQAAWRTADLARRIASDPPDGASFDIEPGLLDPRDAIASLNQVLPREWEMVNSSGHCSYFSAQMRGREAERFHVIREFGAIGNGLSYAIGVAVAKPDGPIVLIDGDGGFLMHVQELETICRHGLRLLICILNDGAYGSEIHKLRADGLSDKGAVFGHGDIGAIARGFGLRGSIVTDLGDFARLIEGFQDADTTEIWDIHVSDQVTSPVMRRAHPKKH